MIKNVMFVVIGVVSLYIDYITGTGEILNYVDFTDPLNEMGFCFTCLCMGVGCIYVGLAKDDKVPCSKELDMEWANESENIQ